METRIEKAVEKKLSGRYNCAQAVACIYADIAGVDEDTMMHINNSFGVGMGNMEGTCGALTGAGVVLGLVMRDRAKAMRAMRNIMNGFAARNTTTICKVLKGVETKCLLRECHLCVADAAALLEAELSAR